jgi:hypothetical protein
MTPSKPTTQAGPAPTKQLGGARAASKPATKQVLSFLPL